MSRRNDATDDADVTRGRIGQPAGARHQRAGSYREGPGVVGASGPTRQEACPLLLLVIVPLLPIPALRSESVPPLMVIEPALVIAPVVLVTLIVLFASVIVAPASFVSPLNAPVPVPVPLRVSVAPLVVKVRLPPLCSISELILRLLVVLMTG